MKTPSLRTYKRLGLWRWPRTYIGKFWLVACIGILLPPVGMVAALLAVGVSLSSPWMWALLSIAALLITASLLFTLPLLRNLLAPTLQTALAMKYYSERNLLPALPTEYPDEAGQLMRCSQETLARVDKLIAFQKRLVRVVSHDVRTPLSSILMATTTIRSELMHLNGAGESIREMMNIIQEAAQYQMGLLESLLNAARADTASFQVHEDKVTLHTLFDLVVTDTYLLAQEKSIKLNVNLETTKHMILQTDVTKLRQVLNNLVSNAIKFSPRGGRIELGATTSAGSLLLYVEDHGIGIPPDKQHQLFDPFTEARRNGTEAEQGFGLGLWVSKTFTELLGGSLDVESRPGDGSTFIVHFPLSQVCD